MALFTPEKAKGQEPKRGGSSTPREPGLSIIAVGMRVEGELRTDGIIKVEGVVAGTIYAEQQVLVAKGGLVEGDIHTREAILGGEVRGAILADQRVEVQSSSVVQGDITTQRIMIHEGGEVNGHVRMGDPRTPVDAVRELQRPTAGAHS